MAESNELRIGQNVRSKRGNNMNCFGIVAQITGTGRTTKYLIRFEGGFEELLIYDNLWKCYEPQRVILIWIYLIVMMNMTILESLNRIK